jgi:putative transposase
MRTRKIARVQMFCPVDQESQFTSEAFTGILNALDIRISMDGRGRWLYNIFVERPW